MSARKCQPEQPKADSKGRLRVWLKLLAATREIEASLRERLRVTYATTLPRFDVMAALARTPDGLTMTALSRQLLVSNGNVTGIVARLVADGIIVRVADNVDKRATVVRLTANGVRTFETMAAAHERWVDAMLADLDDTDIRAVLRLLARAVPDRQRNREMSP